MVVDDDDVVADEEASAHREYHDSLIPLPDWEPLLDYCVDCGGLCVGCGGEMRCDVCALSHSPQSP